MGTDISGRYRTIGYAFQVLSIPILAFVPEKGWIVAFLFHKNKKHRFRGV